MILQVEVNIPELLATGKAYAWPRPSKCPQCSGSRLWGHGSVKFRAADQPRALILKRLRCIDCASVITLKPSGYLRRFRSSVDTVYQCLRVYLQRKSSGVPQPYQHKEHRWLTRFVNKILMDFLAVADQLPLVSWLDYFYCHRMPFLA
jgi:hypothetical protein